MECFVYQLRITPAEYYNIINSTIFNSTNSCSSGPSVVPVCASRKHRHYSGNRHYSLSCFYYSGCSHLYQAMSEALAEKRHYRGTSTVLEEVYQVGNRAKGASFFVYPDGSKVKRSQYEYFLSTMM